MRPLPLQLGSLQSGSLLFVFLLVNFSAALTPAYAEDPIDCSNASTTVEMNFCSDKDFQVADQKLNSVYKKVLAHIAETGGEKPYDAASWEEAMRVSQRAWVTYRDADCKGAVPMEWSGGTGTSSAVTGCMTSKTQARTEELTERYLEN